MPFPCPYVKQNFQMRSELRHIEGWRTVDGISCMRYAMRVRLRAPVQTRQLQRGVENEVVFAGPALFQTYKEAREKAKLYAGVLGIPTIPFVPDMGPYKGTRVLGSQSRDRLRGWRLDVNPGTNELHINWWDHSADPDGRHKSKRLYGANYIQGAGLAEFWEIVAHFPKL